MGKRYNSRIPGMESDIALKLQKFSLSVKEQLGVDIEDEDIVKSKDECKRSLFGKVLGNKKVNYTGLKNTMLSVWPIEEPFVLRELVFNLFQFVFRNKEDLMRVVEGRVWSFDSQWIILKEWKEGLNIKEEKFVEVDLWVQVWNLPARLVLPSRVEDREGFLCCQGCFDFRNG
ncbi:hypothetical protein DH2020_007234 [Rehmannia glutinosa]|uniref:DUF4283 domain-containing protein n=1 Tax=Rehmannia glutinosa TaxID=99300 RepID=A0ABR0TXG6_REHGL